MGLGCGDIGLTGLPFRSKPAAARVRTGLNNGSVSGEYGPSCATSAPLGLLGVPPGPTQSGEPGGVSLLARMSSDVLL